ncbi:hypothetical protein Tco_0622089 [Tanacetum coccineum]
MDLETAQITTTAKLPTLKQGEYDMWRLRIEQYFQVQDYALWDVIENGNSFKPAAKTTTNADGTSTTLIPGPVTTEEKVQKKNDMKARSMLLMALLNEHLMTFNQYKDAKTLFAAIQTRFGGFRRLNKPDLDTMSFDDLYNNFKIVKQEVKGTASSSSSSHNMAFVSSPSSTNKFNTAYEDLEQIHEDDIEEMDLKWQLALLSIQIRRFFQKSGRSLSMGVIQLDMTSLRRIVNVEEIYSKAMLAIDGAGFDWSYMTDDEVPTNMALMAFLNSESEFEGYGPKPSKSVSEDTSNEVKESPDAPLVEELVSDDKLEKKTIFPTVAKIEFVRAKQQEKPVRKPVKYAEMYRSQSPKGNQRNWNNQKSQQLGSNFVMYNKACFVCGSFDHVQANCNYHQRERVVSGNNYTRVNYNYSAKKTHPSAQRNMVPRAVLMKTGLRSLNFSQKVNTAKGSFYTARPKAVNTARPNSAVVNAVRANQGHLQKEDQGYVDSGCSRHMTGNMSYLSDFKEFDGGYVTFRGGAKGGKITGKGTLSLILRIDAEKKDDEGVNKESGIDDQERPGNSS